MVSKIFQVHDWEPYSWFPYFYSYKPRNGHNLSSTKSQIKLRMISVKADPRLGFIKDFSYGSCILKRPKMTKKNEILIFFAHAFSKNCKKKFKNIQWDIYQKNENFEKLFFSYRNQWKILLRGTFCL